MRNLRKLTAVVLAVALVLTSMAAAFAATEDSTTTVVNGDKAAVLKELKLYAGTDDTNPAAGLEKPLEVQQALAFLATEFGYKAEADKLADEDADKALAKFVDGKDVATYAKKVVAYSVEKGIIAGEKTNDGKLYIRPAAAVKATRFATFILKGLGYDLTGSFTESVAQLAEVDGSKIDADVSGDLTRDAAVGIMYGILTAKTESGKTVAENLLAADSSLQSVLSKNNLLPVNGTLAVDSVKTIANNKIEVKLKEEAAATAADFSIVKKGTTTAVAVKDVVKESEKVFVVETDALTAGTSYTLTANGVSVNFTGIAVDNTAPTVVKVTSPDTNTFEVEYSDKMDSATATDIANYTFDKSLKAVKAELNDDRNKVKITADAAKRNVSYYLTVANVKNTDGKAISKTSRTVVATEDRTAPRLVSVLPQNNRMLVVKFDDANGMNKAALETLANFSINDLTITSVKAYDTVGDDGKYETVVLMTETQTANKSYTLTLENLTDNSVLANPLGKATRAFRGAPEDKTAPTVVPNSIKSLNNNLVEISFSDNNAMDAATLEDISNYTITYGNDTLEVISAKASDTSYPDGYKTRKVTLTTAAQELNKNYKIEVKAVTDEFGNVLKQTGNKYPTFSFPSSPVDAQPPYVKKVEYMNSTKVRLHLNEELAKATVIDPTNYSINKDIGAPIKATLEGDDKNIIELTTPTLGSNTTYTVTINNVEDRFSNAMSDVKADILATSSELDTTVPSISYMYAPNKKELHIYFDEQMGAHPADITLAKSDGSTMSASTLAFEFAGILDDGKTLVYRAKTTSDYLSSDSYVIATTDAVRFADKAGNKLPQYTTSAPDVGDRLVFSGNTADNDRPVVEYIEQVNVKKLKVVFSEPVKLVDASYTIKPGNEDIADTYQTEWTITRASKFKVGEVVNFTFSAGGRVIDLAGDRARDTDETKNRTSYTTYLEDTVKPTIMTVVAVNKNKVEVNYDEDIENPGSYKITREYTNTAGTTLKENVAITNVSKDGSKVILKTAALKFGNQYYLEVMNGAIDLAGNREDKPSNNRFDFTGTDIEAYDFVKGVGITNALEIYVTATQAIGSVSIYEKGDNDAEYFVTSGAISKEDDEKKVNLWLALPVLSSKEYVAKVAYKNGGGTDEFTFEGNTPDMGFSVTRDSENKITIDLNGYKADEYYTIILPVDNDVYLEGDKAGDEKLEFTVTDGSFTVGSEYYVLMYRNDDKPTKDAGGQISISDGTVVFANKITLD